MPTRDTAWEEEVLQEIVGRQLGSVEFVQDYVQLHFDGPGLTAITQPALEVGSRELAWDTPGFRDELCRRIAREVVSARIIPNVAVRLEFDDGAVVKISLRDEDYRAAEAVQFEVSAERGWAL